LRHSYSFFTNMFAGALVRVYRESANLLKGETVTGGDGRYAVENLIPSKSPYRVDVLVNGMLRARRRGIVVPAGGGSATVDIELVGVGVVTGRALPPSGKPSLGVTVTLTSLARTSEGSARRRRARLRWGSTARRSSVATSG
jgi:hypothetical protein